MSDVEKAFHSACILHNMLHTLNGYDIEQWERNVVWDHIDPDSLDYNEETTDTTDSKEDESTGYISQLRLQPIAAMINPTMERTEPIEIPVPALAKMQRYLIDHLDVAFRLGRLRWPRHMASVHQKRLMLTDLL